MKKKLITLCSLALALAGPHLNAAPLGTAFTYQGRLTDGTNPANGTYYMLFTLHDALEGGNQVASQPTNTVSVANGLFTVDLDFGAAAFTGNARWLTINVRTNGGVGVDLAPRTRLAPAPNAIYASTAGSVTNGAIQVTQLGTAGAPSPGQVLSYNGSSLVWQNPAMPGDAWALGGNNAASGNFVGSLNDQPLLLKANGSRILRLEPNIYAPNLIGGSANNFVSVGVEGATIAGGGTLARFDGSFTNAIAADYATIGGGLGNRIALNGFDSTIAGGRENVLQFGAYRAAIGGGIGNTITSNSYESTIAGGVGNTAESNGAFVGGGYYNHAKGSSSTLAGGYDNTVTGGVDFIGGGARNRANNSFSTIAGGENNTASADYSSVGGGGQNSASGISSHIGGGFQNTAENNDCAVGGGYLNHALGLRSTVAGGENNSASGGYAAIGGGYANTASGGGAVVSGGENNRATGSSATVAGGAFNLAGGSGSTVGGGVLNGASGVNTAIAGGSFNSASGTHAAIGGGNNNRAEDEHTTISGGEANLARSHHYGTIGGGVENSVDGSGGLGGASTISGGRENSVDSHDFGSIGGGLGNRLSHFGFGNFSATGGTVPGGYYNEASGDFSFAAGRNAKAVHNSSIVFSSRPNPAYSFADERFQIHAFDGFGVDFDAQRADGGGARWVYIGRAVAGQQIATSTGAYLSDVGVWQNASDRKRKTDFAPANSGEILRKLAALPIQTWRYTNDAPTLRHLGPTAQDFKAAFGLGADDKSIGTVDADGVALAAIQGLNQKLEEALKEKDAKIARLEKEMAGLKSAQLQASAEWDARFTTLQKVVARLAGKSATTLVVNHQTTEAR